MSPLSKGKTHELIRMLQPSKPDEVPEAARVTVHAAISRFAVLYEKIRNAVDYKDEHLIRKSAIKRILKRLVSLEQDSHSIANHLIRELIAARYLPNGVLPDTLITQTTWIVNKYLVIRARKLARSAHYEWLIGVVAAEIEELVSEQHRETSVAHFLFEQLANRIQLVGAELEETERRLQIYIACHRGLSKADDEMLSYRLVRAYHQGWMQPETWDNLDDMALKMVGVELNVKAQLAHPLAYKFQQAVKPAAVSIMVLQEALLENLSMAQGLLEDEPALNAAIARIADRRMAAAKARLKRGTVRAMIYLFITKSLLALGVEIPVELIWYKAIHYPSLAINVLFPPLMMYLVGALIRMPGKENTDRMVKTVQELLSPEGPKMIEIRIAKERSFGSLFFFRVGYLLMFACSFGLVFALLGVLEFTWVSSLIFLFFLCVVSFFGFRLRTSAREYVVIPPVVKFSTAIADFFSIPILRAGQWLSEKVQRVNVFIFLFDFIIETPFKMFLEILEEWLAFMKEKKEELQ